MTVTTEDDSKNERDRREDNRPKDPSEGDEGKTYHILGRMEQGDRRALDDLFRHFGEFVLGVLYAKMGAALRAKTTPEDLRQEVFRRALPKVSEFRAGEQQRLRGFLVLLCEEVVTDESRRWHARKRSDHGEVAMDAGERPMDLAGTDTTPSVIARKHEFRQRLDRCMAALSPRHRRVLELRIGRKMPLKNVAIEMNISEDAVSELERRAREKLKQCFDQDGAGSVGI